MDDRREAQHRSDGEASFRIAPRWLLAAVVACELSIHRPVIAAARSRAHVLVEADVVGTSTLDLILERDRFGLA